MSTKFDPTAYMIKLQGKDYLPVAARIVWMRSEHPDWSIVTEPINIGQALYMRATVATDDGRILATAHKAAAGRKGTAAQYPVEAGETGAIGRALGLCGYGALSGDLDEGDEIADSPQDPAQAAPRPTNGAAKPAGNAPRYAAELQPVGNAEGLAAILDALAKAQNAFETDEAKARAKTMWRTFSKAEQAEITAAVKHADETMASMVPATGTV